MDFKVALSLACRFTDTVVILRAGERFPDTVLALREPGCLLAIRAQIPFLGRIALPVSALKVALSGLRQVTRLSLHPDGQAAILEGVDGARTEVRPTWNPERVATFPDVLFAERPDRVLTPAEGEALLRAATLTELGQKSGRAGLGWVRLGAAGVWASDEVRLAFAQVPCPEALVPGVLFRDLSPGALALHSVGPGAVVFYQGDTLRAFEPSGEHLPTLPDFERAWTTHRPKKPVPIQFDPRALTAAIRAAAKAAPSPQVSLQFSRGQILVLTQGTYLPVQATHLAHGRITLDTVRLLATLRASSRGQAVWWYSGPSEPIEILETHYREIFMPIEEVVPT